MNMESFIKRFPLERLANRQAKSAESAKNCIECGECEERCPYEIPVIERVQQGADALNKILNPAV